MIKKFLDLGYQPLANNYRHNERSLSKVKNDLYKLEVSFDNKSKLVSISKKVSKKKMFNDEYPYKSSMSKTMLSSFKNLHSQIMKRFNPKKFLEIGSNDGALIKNFNKNSTICVEPCANLAKITKKMGYQTYPNYWDTNLSSKLKQKFGTVDVIYAANTITHIANLNNVFRAITNILDKRGVLIIEDPSLLECLKKVSYDQFYNEHIYVFSAIAVKNLIKKFNLEIFDIQNLKTHGGSLRYFIKRKENNLYKVNTSVYKQINKEINFGIQKLNIYKKFAISVKNSKIKLIKILKNLHVNNKKVIGYGATAKSTTVLNYCKIDKNLINFFVDTTPDKANKFMPGKNIKIYKYNVKLLSDVDYIFLGAWNFKKEILKKEKKFLKRGGKFITHVPYPKIISS